MVRPRSWPPYSLMGAGVVEPGQPDKEYEQLWYDADAREETLREIVSERLAAIPPPSMDDFVVATYFFAFCDKICEILKPCSFHIKHGP
jgi:hypothetical protein